jgi:Ca-activated chloride channel family protein
MRQRLALLLLVVSITGASSTRSHGQARREGQLPPTFGAEIEVVNLNVSVTNAQGQYVTRLGETDFAVFEDGVRQELTIFKHEDLPLSLVLVLDGSASMTDKMKDVQSAAKRFLQTLRKGDEAQLVQFSDRITVLQEFTSDVKALEEALHRAEASGPTALHNALYVSLKDLSSEKRRVGGELRRRAIVLLSDGEDTSSLVTDDQVLDLAKKTEINIYPILIRNNRSSDSTRPAFSQADYLLTTLARETGGQSFMPNSISELDKVYDRIAEELRTLFSLGYVSSNPRRDGKWRRIVVRVTGRDDLSIRHKLGYYAPSVTR